MDDILDEMYPNPDMEPPNSVAVMRTLIMRLRKKIAPYRIKNVRGRGYMLLTEA
jgi:DNA-binding response OmpR family regulator